MSYHYRPRPAAPEPAPPALICPICHEPITPRAYWCAVFLDPGTLAHIICLWALQIPVE